MSERQPSQAQDFGDLLQRLQDKLEVSHAIRDDLFRQYIELAASIRKLNREIEALRAENEALKNDKSCIPQSQ